VYSTAPRKVCGAVCKSPRSKVRTLSPPPSWGLSYYRATTCATEALGNIQLFDLSATECLRDENTGEVNPALIRGEARVRIVRAKRS
jgi:hypothetical protein